VIFLQLIEAQFEETLQRAFLQSSEVLGLLPGGWMQCIADRDFDINIADIEGDLAQIADVLSLRHLRGETEPLQERIGPGEKFALALGLGVGVRFGIRLRERDELCHDLLPSRKVCDCGL
jgi:hypothetical protein